MTYQNDPHNRRPAVQTNYTPWILGGLAALALIVGVIFMSGNRNNTSTATNTRPATTTTMPATTGSGSTTVPAAPTTAPVTPTPTR